MRSLWRGIDLSCPSETFMAIRDWPEIQERAKDLGIEILFEGSQFRLYRNFSFASRSSAPWYDGQDHDPVDDGTAWIRRRCKPSIFSPLMAESSPVKKRSLVRYFPDSL